MDQPGINSPFRVLPLRDFDWNSKQFVYLTQCAGSTEWRVNSCVWRFGGGGVRILEYWAWSTNWDIALRSSWSKFFSEVPPGWICFQWSPFWLLSALWTSCVLTVGYLTPLCFIWKVSLRHFCQGGLTPQLLYYLLFIKGHVKLHISASPWIK